jgi:hypothetical protein
LIFGDNDWTLLYTDFDRTNIIGQVDVNSLKVVREFEFDLNKAIKDFKLLGGKNSEF